jgi:hypothetical protein
MSQLADLVDVGDELRALERVVAEKLRQSKVVEALVLQPVPLILKRGERYGLWKHLRQPRRAPSRRLTWQVRCAHL